MKKDADKDISFTDMDHIFFPDHKIRDSREPQRFSSDDLDRLGDVSPEKIEDKGVSPAPSRILIEDATPIPNPEEGAKNLFPAGIDLSRKVNDIRTAIKKKKATTPPKTLDKKFFSQLSGNSEADITKVFVPANRIDEKGNVLPEPPDDATGAEKPAAQKKMQPRLYTFLLAYGRKIHFRKTIDVCARFLEITPQEAERRIRFGKGVLFSGVTEDQASYLEKQFLSISQGIRVIEENALSRIPEAKEVIVWLFSKRHFQTQTEKEKLVLPWDGVRLVCYGCARLHFTGNSYKKVMDVITVNPFVHLRIWDATFDYKSSGIHDMSPGDENFINLVKSIRRFTQKGRFFPNLVAETDEIDCETRKFESVEEFDNYVRWLFLSYFGKPLR